MPDAPRDWLELFALASTVVIAALLAWALWLGIGLLLDWRRSTRTHRPVVEAAAAAPAAAAVKRRRSPFAPNRAPKQREAR